MSILLPSPLPHECVACQYRRLLVCHQPSNAECPAKHIPSKTAVNSHEKLTKDREQLLRALKGLEALINDPDVNCRIRYDVGDLKRWGDYWVLAIAAIKEAERKA